MNHAQIDTPATAAPGFTDDDRARLRLFRYRMSQTAQNLARTHAQATGSPVPLADTLTLIFGRLEDERTGEDTGAEWAAICREPEGMADYLLCAGPVLTIQRTEEPGSRFLAMDCTGRIIGRGDWLQYLLSGLPVRSILEAAGMGR
ncbi:hypothetical protein [Piscinibacterium candidicorallinum]|uniref:Uncharacterized protein n=1 Tax=Piscinibacterium candidicorallinum TaxID=1793872 RepID=A0ABV7H644_9BURK